MQGSATGNPEMLIKFPADTETEFYFLYTNRHINLVIIDQLTWNNADSNEIQNAKTGFGFLVTD